MHYKVEKNATRKGFGRELSLEVFAVAINKNEDRSWDGRAQLGAPYRWTAESHG